MENGTEQLIKVSKINFNSMDFLVVKSSDVSRTKKPTLPTDNFPNRTEGLKKFWKKLEPTNQTAKIFSILLGKLPFLENFA